MRRHVAAIVVVCCCSAFAQTIGGQFEVASVKRTNGTPGVVPFVFIQSGRLRAPFSTLRELVQAAYELEANQVIGGPDWVDSDHFEVNATLPTGTTPMAARVMLRSLLAERFRLVVKEERRELPVYFLKRGGRLGPQMAAAGPACKPLVRPAGIPVPPPPPPPPSGGGQMTPLNPTPGSKCGNIVFNGFLSMRSVPMLTLVTYLSRQIERPIIDQTKLAGVYDIDLSFLPDEGPMMLNGTALNVDAPSLQTAVREQLGLRLDSGRAPLNVIVIADVSIPMEN